MEEKEMRKIGEYLELKYVIARDAIGNDKLEIQDKYIQQLYDAYLDLKIENNKLQSQLTKFKKREEKIREYINEYKFSNVYDEIKLIDGILSILESGEEE